MLGSIGTLGCFSFDYYKILNCGEGGFVVTNDEWLYTRAQSLARLRRLLAARTALPPSGAKASCSAARTIA